MIIDDSNFERIEKKIADIQDKIDRGLMNPGVTGDTAVGYLRGARGDLFALRAILHESIEIEPTVGPDNPDAA
jgi:hypothetical protein